MKSLNVKYFLRNDAPWNKVGTGETSLDSCSIYSESLADVCLTNMLYMCIALALA